MSIDNMSVENMSVKKTSRCRSLIIHLKYVIIDKIMRRRRRLFFWINSWILKYAKTNKTTDQVGSTNVASSVTRFCDILPLWQNFKALGNFDQIYLVFGKTLNLLWQINFAIGQIFIVVNGRILSKLSSDLVTLVASEANAELRKKFRKMGLGLVLRKFFNNYQHRCDLVLR